MENAKLERAYRRAQIQAARASAFQSIHRNAALQDAYRRLALADQAQVPAVMAEIDSLQRKVATALPPQIVLTKNPWAK
jgi:hypothetical protein